MTNAVALITGGASGIGKATAIKLASLGIHVVISDRRRDVGEAAAKEICGASCRGDKVQYIQNDVTNEDHVKSLIATIIEEFGQLDMAVNNAGISSEVVSIDASNSDNYSAMVNTNLVGLYYCMKHQIIQMLKQKQGAIVNVASIASLNGIPWAATYASTKHGVVGLTKSAAIDHAQQGIRINAVAPGAIRTDIIAKQLDGHDENYNQEIISAIHPMNRLGKPEEVANGIAWLL